MSPENAINEIRENAIIENREKREKLQKCFVFQLFQSNKDLENVVFELFKGSLHKKFENQINPKPRKLAQIVLFLHKMLMKYTRARARTK